MARIAPFRGFLYNPNKVHDLARVIAPPYDVISPAERARLGRKSPYNIVHLDLNHEADAYQTVARLFEEWQKTNVLVRDETSAIYFLSHRFRCDGETEMERLGFIALTRLEDFSTGTIRPHEHTLAGPKQDRFQLMVACGANLSSIFALYSQPKGLINRMLWERVQGVPPILEVREDQGGLCRLWRITDSGLISLVQREMQSQPLLIADGHHRYEAALNYRDHLRRERQAWTGQEAFNYVMAYFANMKDEGLVILPTHRLLRDFHPIPFQELEEALQRYFYLEAYPKTSEGRQWFLRALGSGRKRRRLIGVSFKRDPRYLILRLKNKRIMQRLARDLSAHLRDLDVTVLHLLILEHILKLSAEDQLKEGVLSYSQDAEKVLQAVEKEDHQAAFLLNPTDPEKVLTIALGGERMPQKSTYFYPKLITGLVINKIDPNEEIEAAPEGR
ncbi:MAG: DUF1015 domain-containing protein [Deltaproteobacteria bacterium]|nr:DUF1015 domain-containing protein [Deltaproteobacteria bacterium]